jgi:hypothetical protein
MQSLVIPNRKQIGPFCRHRGAHRREPVGAQSGGYRVSRDRGDVTVGQRDARLALANARRRYDDVIGNFPV